MAEDIEKQSPAQEIKDKLRQLRTTYTNGKKLIAEIETTYARFTTLRDALADKDNGAKANLAWVAEQKKQITKVLGDADVALSGLQTTARSIDVQIVDMTTQYGSFQVAAKHVFDKVEGLQPIHDAAKKLRDSISKYATQSSSKVDDAQKHLDDIAKKNQDMVAAYDEFLVTKAKIDDTETGLEALLRKATEYAKAASDAKTTAVSELASVQSLKQESDEIVGTMKLSRTEVEDYKKQSESLTDDIRNTLNKTASYSLSEALRGRTRGLSWLLLFWGLLSFISIILLIAGVGVIFYTLFIHGAQTNTEIATRLKDGPTLTSVISKVLFTTPLVYAVYFTTSNFGHVRDLRDKYAWKETVAKNLQTYVKTLKKEFSDDRYEQARFNFTIKSVTGIYSEPHATPKNKKYNFGINKIFRIGLEERHIKEFRDIIEEGVEEIVSDKISESKEQQTTPPPTPENTDTPNTEKPDVTPTSIG